MGQIGVSRAKVDRGYSQLREARDIGPAILRAYRSDQSHEGCDTLRVEAGTSSGSGITHLDRVACEDLAYHLGSLFCGLVWGETIVHRHQTSIGNDVPGNPSRDTHGVETLAVGEPVDDDLIGVILVQDLECACHLVDRVVPQPGSSRVCGHTLGTQVNSQGPLASCFNGPITWFHEDGHICVEELWVLGDQSGESVLDRFHLLIVIEDPGDVASGMGEGYSEVQLDGQPTLHVHGTAANQDLATILYTQLTREIIGYRYGVEMPSDDDTGVGTHRCPRHDDVPQSRDLQVWVGNQSRVDSISQQVFVTADRLDIHDLTQQMPDVTLTIQHRLSIVPDVPGSERQRHYTGFMSFRTASGTGIATIHEDVGVLDCWFPSPTLGHRQASPLELPSNPTASMRGVRQEVLHLDIDLDSAPTSVPDAYLRLHLLSHRLCEPRTINLEGVFTILQTVVWTSAGPCAVAGFERVRASLRALGTVTVFSVDKFPRMVDYVIPGGVRIGDADRVRLGAHLAEGTTVMHEGFVNFNAGTLGVSMIEGRVSAGVVIMDGSDVGGGASIMGTLSGGGREMITIGRRCLLGAQSGIGICLGDDCIVEAGLYITAGTKITLPDGSVSKGIELSGQRNWLYLRDSVTGQVRAVPRGDRKVELNTALHRN